MRYRWLLLPLLLAAVTGCGPGRSSHPQSSEEIVLATPEGGEVRLMETIERPGATATLVNFWSIG